MTTPADNACTEEVSHARVGGSRPIAEDAKKVTVGERRTRHGPGGSSGPRLTQPRPTGIAARRLVIRLDVDGRRSSGCSDGGGGGRLDARRAPQHARVGRCPAVERFGCPPGGGLADLGSEGADDTGSAADSGNRRRGLRAVGVAAPRSRRGPYRAGATTVATVVQTVPPFSKDPTTRAPPSTRNGDMPTRPIHTLAGCRQPIAEHARGALLSRRSRATRSMDRVDTYVFYGQSCCSASERTPSG